MDNIIEVFKKFIKRIMIGNSKITETFDDELISSKSLNPSLSVKSTHIGRYVPCGVNHLFFRHHFHLNPL
jgi:hypothetical protein